MTGKVFRCMAFRLLCESCPYIIFLEALYDKRFLMRRIR
nr:MAG TPA: hypothetical protein [Caudoviricetes sp.]